MTTIKGIGGFLSAQSDVNDPNEKFKIPTIPCRGFFCSHELRPDRPYLAGEGAGEGAGKGAGKGARAGEGAGKGEGKGAGEGAGVGAGAGAGKE